MWCDGLAFFRKIRAWSFHLVFSSGRESGPPRPASHSLPSHGLTAPRLRSKSRLVLMFSPSTVTMQGHYQRLWMLQAEDGATLPTSIFVLLAATRMPVHPKLLQPRFPPPKALPCQHAPANSGETGAPTEGSHWVHELQGFTDSQCQRDESFASCPFRGRSLRSNDVLSRCLDIRIRRSEFRR